METQFAKIVTTDTGNAILIEGSVFKLVGPLGRQENDALVEKIVRLLRGDGNDKEMSSGMSMKDALKHYGGVAALTVTKTS